MIVIPEIFCFKKQKDATAGLVTNVIKLLGVGSFCQQKRRTLRARRSHDYPAFAVAKRSIFNEPETQRSGEERDRFVVIADDERYAGD